MNNSPVTFNQISVGKQFTLPSNITYQKISNTECKPIIDKQGKPIANGLSSTLLYNTNVLVTPTGS